MTQNILVTGGAGFIGSHLCDALLKQNHHIICLDNFNDFYNPKIKEANVAHHSNNPNYTLIRGDILDHSLLDTLFDTHSINGIIHLAARAGVRPSIEEPKRYQQVNIEGTLNILELARIHKIKKLLFASSSSVYGNNKKVPFSESDPVDQPVSPYAATKKAGELLCYNYHHLYHIPIVCLRFFTVYGPRQRPEMAIHKFAKLMSNEQPIPVFNNGNCRRDFTYIDDIIQGIINIYNHNFTFDIVNLGESETITTLNLIKELESQLNCMANIQLMPAQPGDVEQTFADISKAQSTYQYNPTYPFKLGISKFVEWFNKN